ncbi:hypothetical protein F8158_30695 [Bacillus cereus]|uniref:Uncharacterized protein n=1 Tax=Bacillus cereus TaxID=1396 RepID=A0AB34CWU3_BACCE|nr:hypothetical protein [Bacillus cereus]KAB2489960.1 hypothetical protein F8158_30695 [Bacillus cereus]
MGGFEVICDPETFGKLQEQLDQMKEKDIYSVKLNAKMNFLIKELSIPEVMDQMFVEHKRGKGLKSTITQTTMQRMQELVTTITESDLRNQLQARIDDANLILKIRSLENGNITRVSDNEYRVEFKPNISIPEIVGYSVLLSSGGESWAGSGENIVNIDKIITTLTPSSYVNFVITLQNGKSYVLYEQKYS